MGRGLVIICTGMVFVFGLIQLGISNRHNSEAGINISYANWVQARNFAASGMEMGVRQLIQDPTLRYSVNPLALVMDNQAVEVFIDDDITDPAVPVGMIRVRGTCTMGGRTATVSGLLSMSGGSLPEIVAAMAIYSEDVLFSAAGAAFQVNGHDFIGEEPSVLGVAGGNQNVVDKVAYAISSAMGPDQTENIKGTGGEPSLDLVANQNEELKEFIAQYKQIAIDNGTYYETREVRGSQTMGTIENPQVTYINSRIEMTGNSSGAGILIVGPNAELIMTGGGNSHNFNGIIIVEGDARIGGNMKIFGAMLFGGDAPLVAIDLLGHISVHYHSGNVQQMRSYLDGQGAGVQGPRLVSVYE